jgi:hypothetical protein
MIAHKIRKLLVIANDPRSTLNEAADARNMLFFLINLGIAKGNVRLEDCYALVFEQAKELGLSYEDQESSRSGIVYIAHGRVACRLCSTGGLDETRND